jgi:hypothetical protein
MNLLLQAEGLRKVAEAAGLARKARRQQKRVGGPRLGERHFDKPVFE